MEGTEGMNSGVTVKGDEAPESYRVGPRTENLSHFVGPAMAVASPATAAPPGTDLKKKRGRPKKYGPDGKPSLALSPMPISSSIPLTGEFLGWKHGKSRPFPSLKKLHKYEPATPGVHITYTVGANFTPHVITVNAGEDLSMKLLSFSQQGSRAICILSANGPISNVTLRQANSSGGTLTYEGRFEILSLTGSFMPIEDDRTKSRSGGMSVSLAGPDGRVVGGGLAGLLIAAGPVQIVVGSFLPGHHQEQKPKKQRPEPVSMAAAPVSSSPVPREIEIPCRQGGQNLNAPSPSTDNWASFNSMQQRPADPSTEKKTLFPGGESRPPFDLTR